ncbi:TonB-dependent receptor [Ideonella margarita]|uniref:TonB-dependent receptor n=1 Tax=Ideonella margarita TaxID=2984191 RepID=A0ABU9CAG3_9BURK
MNKNAYQGRCAAGAVRHQIPAGLSALALAVLALSPSAQAQEAAATEAVQLAPVTVTATRRAESLQKVPVSVSVITGEQLEQANRNTLGALVSQLPSVNFRTGASNKDTSLFVRGVGTISTSPGVEPTVSTVIDGVVLARPGQASLDLLDVQRVEVLRGSQGTLFGKNSSAGVINIISNPPSQRTEGYIDASHFTGGNENRLRAGISGQLAEGLRGSLTALAAGYDGNVTNVFNGEKVNGYEKKGLRAKLEWQADQALKFTLAADVLNSHDDIPTGVVTRTQLVAFPSGTVSTFPAFAAALAPVVASDSNRQINSNLKTEVQDRNRGVSLTGEARLGSHTLTSITAWRAWDNTQVQDGDRLAAPATGLPQSHDRGTVDFDQWSQELRLASPRDGNFDYVGGLFYLHTTDSETYRRDVRRVGTGGALYDDNGVANFGSDSTSTAVYGEGRWHFNPELRAILGLRWTEDKLSFDHQRTRSVPDAQFNGAVPGVNADIAQSGDTRKTGVSGRTGLQWDIAPDATTYLTYSRGYKGPAYNVFFNMQARDNLALNPETSNSVEAGLKTELLDRSLRLNLSAFSTKYQNYQANFFDLVSGSVVTRLINAGDVSSRGIELDANWRATSQLSFGAALAYTRARIDHFNCPVGAATSCQVDGKPLPFAPDWKGSLQANYRFAVGGGWQADVGTDYNWQSKTQYDIGQFEDTVQGAYGIWNASIAFSQPASGWRVALLAKNLTDRSYASFLGRGGSYVNRWVPRDDQRYFGINVRKDF